MERFTCFRVRNNVYMLVGDGGNIVVQTGDEGAFVVDSGAGQLTDKVLAAIRRLSAKPIQFIANTSFHADHTGGNEKLKNAGSDPSVVGTFLSLQFPGAGSTASIMAHENVAARMDGSLGNPPTPAGSWPIDTYMAGPAAQVPQRRQHRDVLRAQREHGRRQHRPLPARRRHRGRRRFHHHSVSVSRSGQRRQRSRRNRRPGYDPFPDRFRAFGRRRDVGRSGSTVTCATSTKWPSTAICWRSSAIG